MDCDSVVIGGGIVGLATARALLRRFPGRRVVVLEKEAELARHQTSRNSGVIHSGIYYAPGSLKARLAVEGCRKMTEFCQEHGIDHRITGKVIVATEASELGRLETLAERAGQNGVAIERWSPEALREREPHVQGLAALFVPSTGIVSYRAVAAKLAEIVVRAGPNAVLGELAP